MHVSFSITIIALLASTTLGVQDARSKSKPFLIHQFPNGTWVENLTIRSKIPAEILATVITSPEVYLLTPTIPSSLGLYSATPLANFSPATAVLGITEVGKVSDLFAVVTGTLNPAANDLGLGSYAIQTINLKDYPNKPVATKTVCKFPDGGLLNGLSTLDAKRGLVVASDSILGMIWLCDINTGHTQNVISSFLLGPPGDSPPNTLGVNGLKVSPYPSADFPNDPVVKDVYFSVTGAGTFNRIAINTTSLAPASGLTLLAAGLTNVDDFSLTGSQNGVDKAYLATVDENGVGQVVVYDASNGDTNVLANGGLVEGVTSAATGLGEKIVYFSTHGKISPEDGKVVAVVI